MRYNNQEAFCILPLSNTAEKEHFTSLDEIETEVDDTLVAEQIIGALILVQYLLS